MSNKLKIGFASIFTGFVLPLISGEPVCHHCEEIRLYNAEHHKNYEYYEDYLKDDATASNEDNSHSEICLKKKPADKTKDVAEREVPKK